MFFLSLVGTEPDLAPLRSVSRPLKKGSFAGSLGIGQDLRGDEDEG
jgi:hypothetical protein